jgi:uncharacterized protein
VTTLGSDLAAGERPQLFVPGDTFRTSRLGPGAGYALRASTEWPQVEPPDVEHGNIEALVESYPDMDEHIRAFTSYAAVRTFGPPRRLLPGEQRSWGRG